MSIAAKLFTTALALASLACTSFATNLVVTENQQPGTTDWQLGSPSYRGEIQGYTNLDAVNKGQQIGVCVSTVAGTFNLQVFRMGYYQGKGGSLKMQVNGIAGHNYGAYVAPAKYPTDCNDSGVCKYSSVQQYDSLNQPTNCVQARWPVAYRFTVSTTWVSGYYLIKLTEMSTGKEWHVPFVVRDDTRQAALYYKAPFDTDVAYNYWGGASVYRVFPTQTAPVYNRATTVSYDRPFASNNGTQNFFLYEYPILRFLEEQGYDVAYTTDTSIASGQTTLARANGLVVPGHDEYVSQDERAKIEAFVGNGGSAAYFSGNDMYWQTRLQNSWSGQPRREVACYKVALDSSDSYVNYRDPVSTIGPLGIPEITDNWSSLDVHYSESNFMHTGWASGVLPSTLFPLQVNAPDSWVFAGTGLNAGDTIPNVVGWEVDKATPPPFPPDPSVNVTVVSHSPYVAQGTLETKYSDAVLTEHKFTGGMVFHGSSVCWGYALTDFTTYLQLFQGYPAVPENTMIRKVTSNILDRMSLSAFARKQLLFVL